MKFYHMSIFPTPRTYFLQGTNFEKVSLICMAIKMSIDHSKRDISLQEYVRAISITDSDSAWNSTLDQYFPTARTYFLQGTNFKKKSWICMHIMMSIDHSKRDVSLQEYVRAISITDSDSAWNSTFDEHLPTARTYFLQGTN